MVSDRAVETMQRAVEVLISPADIQRAKSVSAAISPAGDVLPDAVKNVIPWLPHDGNLDGAIVTGSNQLRWHLPQGGTIRHVSFDVKTPPTGGGLTFTISGGSTTQTFSLQDGQTTGSSAANITAMPGAWIRLNVTTANGAADLSVTLHYQSGISSAGSTSAGGTGGGGGGAVASVNGQTGVVVLNADSIDDTATTHKFMSAAEKTKLGAISGTNTGDQDLSGLVLASSLHLVATTGQYSDLTGKPTIPAQFNPIAGANVSLTGTYPNITFNATGGGGGDMFKAVYDPGNIAGDAFSMDTMVEGTTRKILTATERTKLAGIATGATANATNAQLRDRATHTGTQSADTITDGTTNKAYTAAEKTKLAGIAAGAEVNVNADWNAVSGDAQILNKPVLYTQSQVNAMFALRAPKAGMWSTGLVVSSAGDYALTAGSGLLTFTGLTPATAYIISWDMAILYLATAGAGISAGVRIVDNGGTQWVYPHAGFDSYAGSPLYRHYAWGFSLSVVANSSGEITICPAVKHVWGSTTINNATITARIN